MNHLTVEFTNPWLLFLLIPAAGLTVLLYLLLNKKFRRNRNRIVSVVLHSIVMVLCIFTLSGMTFRYEVSNSENELILLVDVSDTTEENADQREDFVRSVLQESEYEGCRVGVVTFGFTQENAVPFTYRGDSAYEDFLHAALPDTSATDIAAALQYAHGLFEHPETGKIVLVSDGKQTDEEAVSVIRSIAAQGVTVDTVYFPSEYTDDTVQIKGIILPENNVTTGRSCSIEIIVESRQMLSNVGVDLFDNGNADEDGTKTVDLSAGVQSVRFEHTFREQGLHELFARVQYTDEKLQVNNEYYAYRWLQVHNKLLVIEQADQSERLIDVLKEDEVNYEITKVNLNTSQDIPSTVDELRTYDQVILNNIASRDLESKGLDVLLYDYVHNYGGGLFTTGGTEDGTGEEITPHAYAESDMKNTLYQQMLPVQVIEYTPPVAVMVVVDISGSMLTPGAQGRTNLDWAKQGALECLNALTERDYMGVMTMDTEYGMVLDLTPCTQDALIRSKIESIGKGQNTIYSTAIDRSAQRLAAVENVDKRHIILVTDGMPADSDEARYLANAQNAYDTHGITLSVVGIGIQEGSTAATKMYHLAHDVGHGRLHLSQGDRLLQDMREDVKADDIKSIQYGDFHPMIPSGYATSHLFDGVDRLGTQLGEWNYLNVQLGGYFGSKARQSKDVEILLVGDYGVPLYGQWKFGEGMVGSFMCDVYGDWSAGFMADEGGKQFLHNVIANLMPLEDIRPTDIRLDLREDNYINGLSVYSTLQNGEYIEGKIVMQTDAGEVSYSLNELSPEQEGDVYVTTALGSNNNYSRAGFVIKKSGVYKITVSKCDADGNVLETVETYKSFSYSKEFDYSMEQNVAPEELMAQLAEQGNGKALSAEEYWEIFSTFVTELERVFDPRWLFIGLAMALFLLDIAVRKFKFKWPHELVREYRERKADKR